MRSKRILAIVLVVVLVGATVFAAVISTGMLFQ